MGESIKLPPIKHEVEIRVTYKDLRLGSQCDLHDSDEVLSNIIRAIFYHLREQVPD